MTLPRLFVFNFAGACFVAWAWQLGYVSRLTAADGAHMTLVIAAVFAAGLISTALWAYRVNKCLMQSCWLGGERRREYQAIVRGTGHLHDILVALFILGIIGNAIGFLSAFGGIDKGSLTTAEGLRAAGVHLFEGSGTAFGSTIVGLSLALWTMGNLRILETAIDRLAPND